MGENPLQKLTPEPLSHRYLVRSGWHVLVRADLLGTYNARSLLSGGISLAEARILNRPADISHIMRYLGRGQVLDQQETLQVRDLSDYVGYMIRVYHNRAYSLVQRNSIVAESLVWHGTDYDYRIIAGHLAEAMLGTDGLAERVQDPDRFDCSEGACIHERYGWPHFMGGRDCAVMPEEIDDYCIRAGWEIRTWLLTE